MSHGATDRIRTCTLLITSELPYHWATGAYCGQINAPTRVLIYVFMRRTAYLQRLFAHLTNKCSLYSAPAFFCYAVCLGGRYHTLLAIVLRITYAPRPHSGEPLDN